MTIRNYKRRGVILPLVCVLAFVLLAILTMATDLGYITVCKTQAQAAADAGAIAGAARLATNNLIVGSTSQAEDITAASLIVTDTVGRNRIGLGQTISLTMDPPVFGKFESGAFLPASPADSVRVLVRNDRVPLFLAKLFGQGETPIGAAAIASTKLYTVANTRVNGDAQSPFLPITMRKKDYHPDPSVPPDEGYDTLCTKYVTDNNASVKLYPPNNRYSPGNYGLLQFGVTSRSGSVLCDQVQYGPTSGQMMAQFPASDGRPAGMSPNIIDGSSSITGFELTPYDNDNDNGLRASIFGRVHNGDVRLIPVTETNTVDPGHTSYTIVKWAVVTISVQGHGANAAIWVKPGVFINNGTLVPGVPQTNPGEGGVAVTGLVN